jgi:hypothetical protein
VGDPAACAFDTLLDLYEDDGATLIATSDDDGPAPCSMVTATLTPGTYRVQVQGDAAETGLYALTLSAPPPAEVEPNGSATLAAGNGAFAVPGLISGAIDPVGDVDWLEVSVGTAGPITFATDCATNTDTALTLYAADGTTQIGFADGIPCETMTRTLAAGTYYLVLAHWNDSATGPWLVTLSD